MFCESLPNVLLLSMFFSQPKLLRSVHRPLPLKQSLVGGVLQSLSGMKCLIPLFGSPVSASAFNQVTPIVLCLL